MSLDGPRMNGQRGGPDLLVELLRRVGGCEVPMLEVVQPPILAELGLTDDQISALEADLVSGRAPSSSRAQAAR